MSAENSSSYKSQNKSTAPESASRFPWRGVLWAAFVFTFLITSPFTIGPGLAKGTDCITLVSGSLQAWVKLHPLGSTFLLAAFGFVQLTSLVAFFFWIRNLTLFQGIAWLVYGGVSIAYTCLTVSALPELSALQALFTQAGGTPGWLNWFSVLAVSLVALLTVIINGFALIPVSIETIRLFAVRFLGLPDSEESNTDDADDGDDHLPTGNPAGKLLEIREIATRNEGGVHKRIDENRELLETLQAHAPELLEKHWWVEGWLRSQDGFLNDLAKAVGAPHPALSERFPRPWPGSPAAHKGQPEDQA